MANISLQNAAKNALRNGLNRCNSTASFEHALTPGYWPTKLMVMT